MYEKNLLKIGLKTSINVLQMSIKNKEKKICGFTLYDKIGMLSI